MVLPFDSGTATTQNINEDDCEQDVRGHCHRRAGGDEPLEERQHELSKVTCVPLAAHRDMLEALKGRNDDPTDLPRIMTSVGDVINAVKDKPCGVVPQWRHIPARSRASWASLSASKRGSGEGRGNRDIVTVPVMSC